MDSSMAEQPRTTKSILDNYSGDVLDISNPDKKILDDLVNGISIMEESPKETILDELAELNDKTFNDEFYDLQ
tara:strand:- start:296 stop:514 length:219 start_codon:yes stop_codon:yes gene_type:complete